MKVEVEMEELVSLQNRAQQAEAIAEQSRNELERLSKQLEQKWVDNEIESQAATAVSTLLKKVLIELGFDEKDANDATNSTYIDFNSYWRRPKPRTYTDPEAEISVSYGARLTNGLKTAFINIGVKPPADNA